MKFYLVFIDPNKKPNKGENKLGESHELCTAKTVFYRKQLEIIENEHELHMKNSKEKHEKEMDVLIYEKELLSLPMEAGRLKMEALRNKIK